MKSRPLTHNYSLRLDSDLERISLDWSFESLGYLLSCRRSKKLADFYDEVVVTPNIRGVRSNRDMGRRGRGRSMTVR
uniref:Uncharacterized protein n=1 Tax=Nelumbo nucifera TaxID=4432 RepID=A0A822Z6Z1_NELNU|nr:TPA_asm: hypothetical protein HUJ06_013753 [Nelumbo nucifera]DAD39431.1 TPA_asm: hypothetical protein HUJ06_013754 [Nelumbo nucifera]